MPKKIRVKFVSKNPIEQAHFTELPNRHPELEFVLDPFTRDYDWFVVYDDLPRSRGERSPLNSEVLACPPEHTVLLTYEPSTVKFYGDVYTSQFAHVLTSQEPVALPHVRRHDAPPVGNWYYGGVADALGQASPPEKSGQVCIFMSNKRMGHTLHRERFAFQTALTRFLPELDVYGWGIRYVEKKAECLDRYRYTIAVENHVGPHHWTEKLSDSFLGYCLPFYFGCPNVTDYFPEESFIAIDMENPQAAVQVIREAIASGEYERRLPDIIEARRRVIEDYNLANIVGDVIADAAGRGAGAQPARRSQAPRIHSRRLAIRRRPDAFLRYAFGKFRARRWKVE